MLFDAHNHLQDPWLAPHLERVLIDLAPHPPAAAVINGTHPDDWAAVTALTTRLPWTRPSYGVHPWRSGTLPADWREQLTQRLAAAPAACVGEIGLDRWILDSARPDDPRLAGFRRAPLEEQLAVFAWQLACAADHDRPVTIHCLQAWGPLIDTLRARAPRRFLLHAYGGPPEMVPEFVRLGAFFSFNPSFIDPRKTRQRASFRVVPPDRLLVETDAPAMAPPPAHRVVELPPAPDGSALNHPANLTAAYAALAELRALPVADLHAQVAANFTRCFG